MRSASSPSWIIWASLECWILLVDAAGDLADQAVVVLGRGALAAHLRDDVQALGARPLAVDADDGRIPHAVDAIDDFLDVGRQHVLAAEDDEVLEAAGHVEKALR